MPSPSPICAALPPLGLPWKQAWKHQRGSRLHRLARIDECDVLDAVGDPDDVTHVRGAACCGAEGIFEMPGILSRLGAPRCPACAAAAGVDARRRGIPGNGEAAGPMDAWQLPPHPVPEA